MTDSTFFSDIIESLSALRVVGERPDSMIVPLSFFRLRRIVGTHREKVRARFYNRQRIAMFGAVGIDLTIVDGPKSRLL